MSTSCLENDHHRQAYFAEMFTDLGPTGLKDAVIIHHDSLVADWHLEGKDRVNFINISGSMVSIGGYPLRRTIGTLTCSMH